MKPSDKQSPSGHTEEWHAEELLVDTFARYQDELLGMLYYLVGNMEDARDTFQEAFLKCWRRRRSLAMVENLRAWVFRVALNAGRDARSTAWRRKRQPLGQRAQSLPATDPGPVSEAMRHEQMARLRDAIYRLRPEEQEVFLLRQNGQMTYDQIAQAMDIPTGTAKTRMRLALSKLRELLQPPEDEKNRADDLCGGAIDLAETAEGRKGSAIAEETGANELGGSVEPPTNPTSDKPAKPATGEATSPEHIDPAEPRSE